MPCAWRLFFLKKKKAVRILNRLSLLPQFSSVLNKVLGFKRSKVQWFWVQLSASWHPSFKPMTYELSAMSYLLDI